MKFLDYKTLTAIFVFSLLCWLASGCKDFTTPEDRLNSMHRPVKIVANNDKGLIVQGSDGEIVHWRETYFFAKTMRDSDLMAGDILIP